jgi:hypothetical protein
MPQQRYSEEMIKAAEAELLSRGGVGEHNTAMIEAAEAELKKRKEQEMLANKMLNLDLETGLRDIPMRMKMSFSNTPENALKTLKQKYPEAERLPDGRLIYKNKGTGKNTVMNEERFSLGDLADWTGLVPELSLSTWGAIAGGAATGGPGAVPGAVAGMVVGNQIKKTIGKLFFENNEIFGYDAAKEMVVSGITALAGEGVGYGLVKFLKPFANKILPETMAGMKKFLKFRGRLSPAQATEIKMLDMFENAAEYSILGSEPFRKFRVGQGEGIKEWASWLGNRFGKSVTPEQAGIAGNIALEKSHELFDRAAKVVFGKVDKLNKGTGVFTKSMKKRARQLTWEIQSTRLPSLKSPVVDKLLLDITSLPETISFKFAQGIRSDLLKVARQSSDIIPDQATGIAEHLSGVVDKAMEVSRPSKEALKAWRDASAFWKHGKETFNSSFIKSLVKNNPSKMVKGLFVPGSVENIRLVRKLVDKDTWKQMQQSWLQDLLRPNPLTGIIEGKPILNKLANMGEPTLKEMFDPGHIKDIEQFALMAYKTQRIKSEAPGKMLVQLMQGSAIIQVIGATVAWQLDHPGKAVAILLGPAVLARIFTNRAGIKYLTTGLTIPAGTRQAVALTTKILGLKEVRDYKKEIKQLTGF